MPTHSPAKAGQTVTISVDADGNLTGPLPSTRDNTVVAVTAGCGVWALAAGAIVFPTVLAHLLLNRHRLRHWAHEWKQFDKPPR